MWAGQEVVEEPGCKSPLPAANRPESQEPLPESPVVVGTRVRIVANNVGDRTGLVTYVGETNLATGNWVGLELDAEFKGKHNGTVAGTAYFECQKDRGLLVAEHKVRREDGSPFRSPSQRPPAMRQNGSPKIASPPTHHQSKRRSTDNRSRPGSATSSPRGRRLSGEVAGSGGQAAAAAAELRMVAAERRTLKAEMDELASTKRLVVAERAAVAAERAALEADRARMPSTPLPSTTPSNAPSPATATVPTKAPPTTEAAHTDGAGNDLVLNLVEQLISALSNTTATSTSTSATRSGANNSTAGDRSNIDGTATLGPVLEALLKALLMRVHKCEQRQQKASPQKRAAFSPSPTKGGNATDDDFY